jgi:hypothetical protein
MEAILYISRLRIVVHTAFAIDASPDATLIQPACLSLHNRQWDTSTQGNGRASQ